MGRVETKFKQTEVGLIPVDWEVKSLSKIGFLKKGKGIKKNEVLPDGIACIRYGELYTHHNEYIKTINSYISREVAKQSQKIETGDILFAGSGETREEIGKCATFLQDIEAYAGGDVIIMSPQNCDSLFLGFILNTPVTSSQKAKSGQGDAVVHLYPRDIAKILIPLPPTKTEQTAIANALSDADLYIESLEKLIDKKQKIKQGSLQQLLKPKPNWELKRLGDLCSITTGKLDANAMVENGQYQFYTCAKDFYFIDEYAFETEALLVSGNGANVGYIHYYKGRFNAYQRTYVIDGFNEDILFVKYHLEFDLHKRISIEKKEGNTPYIVISTLTEMLINLPNKEQQKKIAKTLCDIDSEINILTQKLTKAKAIKQGMMQQLLTGKIRLI